MKFTFGCFSFAFVLNFSILATEDFESSFDLFLLAGQSNMAGRGYVEAIDQEVHPRVFSLNKEMQWVPAIEPLHWDKPRVVGVGPGRTFGITIAEQTPGAQIGLIPTAHGGSPIESWEPGGYHNQTKGYPYDEAIARTRYAMQKGTLKAILWNQGGSDARPERAPLYKERLIALIERFRKDLNSPDIPFFIGQLPQSPERPWDEWRTMIDQIHREVAAEVKYTYFIQSDGLTTLDDNIHFDAKSARELGERYAESYISKSELTQRVEALDNLFQGAGSFIASLYDPVSGGFWETQEDKAKAAGKPRLESTGRVMRQIQKIGAWDEMPQEVKLRLIEYYQSFQREDGWFDDPQEKRLEKNRLGRAMNYATRSLALLGAKPKYPLPGESGLDASGQLDHFKSSAQVEKWVNTLAEDEKAWAVGSSISAQRNVIYNIPGADQKLILDRIFSYLEDYQAEDGFWWNGTPYNRLSGAFKVGMVYGDLNEPIPNAKVVLETLLETVENEDAWHVCFVRNPLSLLEVLTINDSTLLTDASLMSILDKSIQNLEAFAASNGGFYKTTNRRASATDGLSQAMTARDLIRKFAGLPPKEFPGSDDFNRIMATYFE